MIQSDFEKFFRSLQKQNKILDFELFGKYGSSILNFYVGSSLLNVQQKSEASHYLCGLFNAGLGNIISTNDLMEISDVIFKDQTLDYGIINSVFD